MNTKPYILGLLHMSRRLNKNFTVYEEDDLYDYISYELTSEEVVFLQLKHNVTLEEHESFYSIQFPSVKLTIDCHSILDDINDLRPE